MIHLTATLWRCSGEGSSYHFLTIPEKHYGEIRAQSLLRRGGLGSVRVETCADNVTWWTSVFPHKSGGYVLPVRRAGIGAGDEVNLTL